MLFEVPGSDAILFRSLLKSWVFWDILTCSVRQNVSSRPFGRISDDFLEV
jgi:hypothetical protein